MRNRFSILSALAAVFVLPLAGAAGASAATVTVNANGDVQAAIDKARPGDTIELQPGATYTGHFTLSAKSPSPGSEQDFVINVGDRVYFDFDRYEVRSDATALLDAQAGWLKRYPAVQVRIEGNCDERGTREYNLALGARRANAVREFLVSHGVEAGRISTVSYGKEKPIDSGSGDTADQHNRNGHTALVSGARMQ